MTMLSPTVIYPSRDHMFHQIRPTTVSKQRLNRKKLMDHLPHPHVQNKSKSIAFIFKSRETTMSLSKDYHLTGHQQKRRQSKCISHLLLQQKGHNNLTMRQPGQLNKNWSVANPVEILLFVRLG